MLAESAEAEDASGTSWIIKLKPDVTFHDGKTLDADDVIFSLQRILDPDTGSSAATTIATVDPKKLEKLDDLTLRVGMVKANAIFTEALAEMRVKIVPVGYDPSKPVGTGPFKYDKFVPGGMVELDTGNARYLIRFTQTLERQQGWAWAMFSAVRKLGP